MVDERRVRRLLQRVSEDLTYLGERAELEVGALLADADRLAAVKYVFVTAIEGCLNAAQHICAAEGWGPPESNADAFRLLERHGTLDPVTANAMAQAVGFRNVLVHGYAVVDDHAVAAFLQRLAVFSSFIEAVAALIGPETAS